MDHQQHAKVERFLKLGYSHSDILRVLESLRHDAQTNDILEELIKTCHARAAHADRSGPASPKLVPRGCSPGPGPSPGQPRPGPDREPASGFRPVVIDGSNVAMSHGDKKVFSCQGLQLAVSWFWDKGLRDITVFVPLWRKEQPRPDAPITDQHVLHELERRKILVYTPSRCVNGKRVVCYDDRYIVKLAFDSDGVIVSNDNYRDLQTENPQWKKFIEERLLMYTFANDKFMPPDDPLGRNGPTIDDFLRRRPWTPDNKLQHCPYGKKCTYGVKCKFYHPERTNQSQLSVADELRAQRDRAKNLSPKPSAQDAAFPAVAYAPPPPPPPDADEAFGSMESSASRPYAPERPPPSYSSGVASYGQSHDDYPSGGGYYPRQNRSLPAAHPSHCRCGYPQDWTPPPHPHHHHHPHPHPPQPAWGSCPSLPPHTDRQSHSLPREPWTGGGGGGGSGGGRGQQWKARRSQLSTLFPQSAVERVMNAYPEVSDMSELISLIQRYRTSHISF